MTGQQPARDSAARQIAGYTFLHVFANDGTINAGELSFLKQLALRDGVIDEDERRVLREIFARVHEREVWPEVWLEMRRFAVEHGLD